METEASRGYCLAGAVAYFHRGGAGAAGCDWSAMAVSGPGRVLSNDSHLNSVSILSSDFAHSVFDSRIGFFYWFPLA